MVNQRIWMCTFTTELGTMMGCWIPREEAANLDEATGRFEEVLRDEFDGFYENLQVFPSVFIPIPEQN